MLLRPYQQAALDASKEKFHQGVTRQLIALPTGTGKTPLFASVPDVFQFPNRMMVLVHREELAQQAADKLHTWNPNSTVGVEMADRVAGDARLVVASVPTIGRANNTRITRFNPSEFDAIIVDEAHHSIAQSYLNIFDYFHLRDVDNKKLLLGVTATPTRGDGSPLGQVYDQIVYQMPILDAIKDGWLVDIIGMSVKTKTSLDGVHTIAGDFSQGELANEVNTPERNHQIVRSWKEHANTRSTIAFTVDIEHAKCLAECFRQYGINAEAVWGDDPQRGSKLGAHRNGQLQVLCNCGVLTEGYDDPNIACIIMARPTKSGLLFVQMAGRGTRLPEGTHNLFEANAGLKKDCLLMDVVDNTSRHSLVTLSSIFGMGSNVDLRGTSVSKAVKKVQEAKQDHPNLDLSQMKDITQLDSLVERVNLFEVKYPEPVLTNSEFQWHQNMEKDSYVLILPNKESIVITQDLLGDYYVVGQIKGASFKEHAGKDLAQAFHQADNLVSTHGSDMLNLLRRKSKWHDDPVTPRQLALMQRLRMPVNTNLSKGDAAKLITRFFATHGQFQKRSAA